ncbi:hypothetical protein SM0020_10850 [Sinorhizobium meliloti CCNWSX0020]|uniref:Uncharacterized protein n=1 Tax=Sinorhizobium meliloti CCNWSX0020 TaxID=1107881 RepID=H0FY94_RHIML|nr:hypothetical protein [Sinorhizobium meliloti]EHK77948.1 hypothetical protein SM0020_10850 [Sinorhizobium meliloti CCNWSX0020]
MLSLDRIGADLAMTPIWIGLLSVLLGEAGALRMTDLDKQASA